jgi:hypothetical protein
VTGTQPENSTAKPNRGELVEAGIFQGVNLTLSVQPGRIDWVVSPNLSQEDEPSGLKTLGEFGTVAKDFLSTVSNWLNSCPASVRLAYGVVLLDPVENRENGYLRISEFIPAVKVDPLGSEDLFYQINRPRESKTVKGLRLNRLSRWSVASFQPLRLVLGIPQNQPAQPLVYHHLDAPLMSCRAEFDLSTAAGIQNELPHDQISSIFNELVDLASEIARDGDVP